MISFHFGYTSLIKITTEKKERKHPDKRRIDTIVIGMFLFRVNLSVVRDKYKYSGCEQKQRIQMLDTNAHFSQSYSGLLSNRQSYLNNRPVATLFTTLNGT